MPEMKKKPRAKARPREQRIRNGGCPHPKEQLVSVGGGLVACGKCATVVGFDANAPDPE